MRFKLTLLFVLIILTAGALAEFKYVGESLSTSYPAGDIVKGKINIQFTNEPVNSLFTSNFKGNISIKDLIEKNELNEGEDFNCTFPGCSDQFKSNSVISSLNLDEDTYIGLVVTGQGFENIDSVSFGISGSAGPSCFSQLSLDLLGEDNKIISNNAYTTGTCFTRKQGCFDTNLTNYQTATIPSDGKYYCEKMTLPPGPAYLLGAKTTRSTTGNATLVMELFNSEEISVGSCELSQHTQQEQEISCVVEHSSSKEGEYFVCIKADDSSNFKIRTETTSPCGTSNFGDTYPIDYEIFAENLQFGSVNLQLDEESFFSSFGESFSEYVGDYISRNYGSDCSDDCVIPIKISGAKQNLQFNNVNLLYNVDGAQGISGNNFYSIDNEPSKINSGNLSLDIVHAGFIVPSVNKSTKFELSLGGKKILNKTISVTPSFNFDITPKFVSFGQLANFKIISSNNISSSSWTFGDGQTAEGKSGVEHRYLSEGQFTLEVYAEDNKGVSSQRTFTITVGDAKQVANTTITVFEKRIGDLDKGLKDLPSWVSTELSKKVNLQEMNFTLQKLKADYSSAVEDVDYEEVMLGLITLNVPSSIKSSESGKVPFIVGYENINPEYIEKLSADDIENKEELKKAITAYTAANFGSEITYQKISAFTDEGSEVLLTKFMLNTNPLTQSSERHYLIIGESIDRIRFSQTYSERSLEDGTYIVLEPGSQTVEFLIAEDLDIEELGAYISPEISALGELDFSLLICNFDKVCDKKAGENRENCPNDCRPWGWFTIWMALLLFGFLVVYIVIQEWYKRNYERHLFQRSEFLYNLVNFLYNARRQGLSDGESRRKLKISGWSNEQINYALKKIEGKRTGMFEIPVFKGFENMKVKKEIERRQQTKVDTRFIKKPFNN